MCPNDRNKKVTAIIQARMGSTRLPGKVLKQVLGKPLLSYMIERVRDAKTVSDIIVATTLNSEDDAIFELCRQLGVLVFRGSEENVLERFYRAAQTYGVTTVMRLTADCPLIDPDLLDELAEFYFQGGYDYASNCLHPTLPDGLDAEVFSLRALEAAYGNAFLPSHLEHVTPYILENAEIFKIGNWTYHKDLSGLRWTVDRPEDFLFVRSVIERLYPSNKSFRTHDVVGLLGERPELGMINVHIGRNEGMVKSRARDKEWHASYRGRY
jgi:spore coat polysaccharide biosynthesis protein SpsF